MVSVHQYDSKTSVIFFWIYSILFVICGIVSIHSIYMKGIVSLRHGIVCFIGIFFMLFGVAFILNQLHYILIWSPREDRYSKKALETAMKDIPQIIHSIGYNNWEITPEEFDIRFRYIIDDNILADFKLHTHTITASYANSEYQLWFKGWYKNEDTKPMILQIIQSLSDHFKHDPVIAIIEKSEVEI